MRRALRSWLPIAAGIAASVLLAAWQRAQGENPWGNAGFQQMQEAASVWAGEGFGRFRGAPGFVPDLFLRPVYTLLLAPLTGLCAWNGAGFRLAVAALQGALNGACGALVGRVLDRSGETRAGTLVRWFCVLDPFLVSQSATVVDTAVFTLALVAGWAAIVRAADRRTAGAWALAGLALGAAILTRSTALALVPVAALRLRDTRPDLAHAVRCAAACTLAAVLALTPWFARNHALTGRWMLSTVDGVNLWMGNNENTARFLDEGRSLDELPGRGELDSLAATTVEEQVRSSETARARALQFVRERPAEAAWLAVRKAGYLWSPVVYPRSTASRLQDLKERVSFAVSLAVYAFGLLGAWTALRRAAARPWARDVLVLALVFTLPHAIAWAGTRLRTPLEPFLLALAAVGLTTVISRFRRSPAPT